MKGFKEFLLRGNLVELAVAFIMGGVFATVVKTFTDIFTVILGKIITVNDMTAFKPFAIPIGAFITALITFLLTALVVYFFVVLPYNKASSLRKKDEPEAASSEDLLADIRDLLRAQADNRPGTGGTTTTDGGGSTSA